MEEAGKVDALDVAFEISQLLDCDLDKETLSICMGLIETGVNPEALAEVIKKIRKEIGKVSAKSQAN